MDRNIKLEGAPCKTFCLSRWSP